MAKKQSDTHWSRRYPPLASAAVAMLLALFVLPSALNVPQSNPTQTLEFAPIPPDDNPPPPEVANLESLSLGTSAGLPADAPGGNHDTGLPPPPAIPDGVGETPVTKRCVGSPPRQSEDPLSPPCVAHFQGDNSGATHAGVSEDEITVLIYMDSARCEGATSRGFECPTPGSLIDLQAAPQDDDHSSVRILRAYMAHFNDRFQTYNRTVHGWAYYDRAGTQGAATSEDRRAEAAELMAELEPFAVMPYAVTYNVDFLDEVVNRGALTFGSLGAQPASFYRQHPGRIWSFLPSIEQQANVFTDFVCTMIAPYPTEFSGNLGENGQSRIFGLLRTSDERKQNLIRYGDVIQQQLEDCGIEFEVTATYPRAGSIYETDNQQAASQNMPTFASRGVTTIIRSQGMETWHSRVAGSMGYQPEWIIAGDGQSEGSTPATFQDQETWDDHAWVVTSLPLAKPNDQRMCDRALREGAPDMPKEDRDFSCDYRTYYEDLRMLFTGIQTAGPRLTPETLDQGLHAIPAVQSVDPTVPACFFEPGDYTCIKDAAVGHWDADAARTEVVNGCWIMASGANRWFAGAWPDAPLSSLIRPDDPCNQFAGSANA